MAHSAPSLTPDGAESAGRTKNRDHGPQPPVFAGAFVLRHIARRAAGSANGIPARVVAAEWKATRRVLMRADRLPLPQANSETAYLA
jgi:hypothetical protein